MKQQTKTFVAIILIIAISISLGIAVDLGWTFLEKKIYPASYADLITNASKEFGVPKYIIYAVIKVESDFDPDAVSYADARGLMQMIEPTFKWLTGDEHLGENLPYRKIFEPETAIRYGTYYLSYLYKKFDYNWQTAFAAYNGGEGNVTKWLSDSEYSDGKGNLTKIPFEETEKYVNKVNHAIDTYKKLYPENT